METILIDKNVMVPMRDGVHLATDVYGLEGAPPAPVFEVAGARYAWLRQNVFVGTLIPVETGNAVRIQFFRVT